MKIKCPACNEILKVNPSMSGQTVDCSCGKKLRVRTSNQKPSSSTSSAAARRFKAQGGLAPQQPVIQHGLDAVSSQQTASSTPPQKNPYATTKDALPNKRILPAQAPSSGLAITSLVLGIVSLLGLFLQCCSGLLFLFPVSVAIPSFVAIPAVAFGVIAIKKANRVEAGGKEMGIVGVVTGGSVLALTVLLIVAVVGWYAYQQQL